MRENEKGSFLFLLNHRDGPASVVLEKDGTDLLSEKTYKAGDRITLEKTGVAIIFTEKPL